MKTAVELLGLAGVAMERRVEVVGETRTGYWVRTPAGRDGVPSARYLVKRGNVRLDGGAA